MTRVPLHEIDIASATEPTLVIAGQLWYDSVTGKLKVYNGTSFDEYCFTTDIDTRIAAHRIETNAHAASKISILDTVAFSSAVQLQGFIDDVGSQFYDKYIVEHNASGVHGPKVTISQSSNDNALAITRSGTGNTTVVTIDNTSSGTALGITSNNTNARTALTINYTGVNRGLHVAAVSDLEGVLIQHSGLQKAVRIDQSALDNALYITQNTDSAGVVVLKTTPGVGDAIMVQNTGIGAGIAIYQRGTGASTGALWINNSGSGYDVQGHSANWTVDKYGNAKFRNVSASILPATVGGVMNELVYDTDWFPGPIRTNIAITHSQNSDFIMGWVRGTGNDGNGHVADWIAPAMQSTQLEYYSAHNELTTNVIRCNGHTYGGATNDIGDLENIYIHTFNTRYFVYNRSANYDSGWIAVGLNTTYTFNHGLGIYPHFIYVELAQNADGSGWRVPAMNACTYGSGPAWRGTSVCKISSTQIKVHTGSSNIAYFYSWAGASLGPTTGYLRVRAYNWTPNFDSGWKSISTAAGNRDKWEWHGFGHFPSLVNLYIADNSVEASQTWALPSLGSYSYSFTNSAMIYHVGTNHVTIKGGASNQAIFLNELGAWPGATSAYYRLLAWR